MVAVTVEVMVVWVFSSQDCTWSPTWMGWGRLASQDKGLRSHTKQFSIN